MKSKKLFAGLLLAAGLVTATVAMADEAVSESLAIKEQGAFAAEKAQSFPPKPPIIR